MGARLTVPSLKRKLLEEVRFLFRRNGSVWKEPILEVLHDLRRSKVRAVLFGGTLRSLLISRVFYGRPGRPRDIDVVVSGAPLSLLEERFADILARRTRFGGLQLKRGMWQFDLWPVAETWAFKHGGGGGPASFARLPSTTTLNLEAIAVEAWTLGGRPRALFSGNDQFFEGILARTVELNRADNPFPELTVVRALVLASELRFKIGPRLASYVRKVAASMSRDVVERVQISHYGHARMESRTLCDLIAMVAAQTSYREGCELPAVGQLYLCQSVARGAGGKVSNKGECWGVGKSIGNARRGATLSGRSPGRGAGGRAFATR